MIHEFEMDSQRHLKVSSEDIFKNDSIILRSLASQLFYFRILISLISLLKDSSGFVCCHHCLNNLNFQFFSLYFSFVELR